MGFFYVENLFVTFVTHNVDMHVYGRIDLTTEELAAFYSMVFQKVYYPYHSLDPAQAIERIIEANDLGEEDYIQKGVALLREILRRDGEA